MQLLHAMPSGWFKLWQLVAAGSKGHAFLDRAWIGALLRLCPRPWRRGLALRLLGLSPHYFVLQWTNRYPQTEYTRPQVLESEFRRNVESRREVVAKVLRRFLRPGQAVLDFGCGPGFMAREVAAHVGRVVGTDVSRGAVACGRALNAAPNLTLVANRSADLRRFADAEFDLVYSFAVFQHLTREQAARFWCEFRRVLKPGGTGVCHLILREEGREAHPAGWFGSRTLVRMVYYTEAEVRKVLWRCGFTRVEVRRIDTLTDIDDDIGAEHLVTFER